MKSLDLQSQKARNRVHNIQAEIRNEWEKSRKKKFQNVRKKINQRLSELEKASINDEDDKEAKAKSSLGQLLLDLVLDKDENYVSKKLLNKLRKENAKYTETLIKLDEVVG